MTRTLRIESHIDADADAVWVAIRRSDTFSYVVRGLLGVKDTKEMPETWSPGDHVKSHLRLFGFIPAGKHEINIEEVDPNSRHIQTRERGSLARVWNHKLQVTNDDDNGSLYVDEIELDAGPLTGVAAIFVRQFFRYRQLRLRRLIRKNTGRSKKRGNSKPTSR